MCRCGRSTQVRPDGSYCRSLMDISGEVISGASSGPATTARVAGVAQDPYHHSFLVPDRRQVLETPTCPSWWVILLVFAITNTSMSRIYFSRLVCLCDSVLGGGGGA